MNEEKETMEETVIDSEQNVVEISEQSQDSQITENETSPSFPSEEELQIPNLSNMTFNRKFRRMLLKSSGYIKMKNKLGYRDWFENVKNNIQNGKQLHASNTEDVIKNLRDSTDKRNESVAASLLEKGYSEERVAEIVEKNMQVQEKIESKKLRK